MKKIRVILEFTSNECYPDDDVVSLHQNIYGLLNSSLVVAPLSKSMEVFSNHYNGKINDATKEALLNSYKIESEMGKEMLNSMKIEIL